MRYNTAGALASVLSGLAVSQAGVATRVVDAVLEEVRVGMEMNSPAHNQRRLSTLRFLGEARTPGAVWRRQGPRLFPLSLSLLPRAQLYNYSLLEADTIFATLYTLLRFGANTPLDPPDHYFRCEARASRAFAGRRPFGANPSTHSPGARLE